MTEEDKQLRRSYRKLDEADFGKVILSDLAKFCHEEDQTVVPGEPDKSLLRAGERNVILRIRRLMKPFPDDDKTEIKHETTQI